MSDTHKEPMVSLEKDYRNSSPFGRMLLFYNNTPGEDLTPYQQGLLRALDVVSSGHPKPVDRISQLLDRDIEKQRKACGEVE